MMFDSPASDLSDLDSYGPDDPLDPACHRPTWGEVAAILVAGAATSALVLFVAIFCP